MPTWGPQGVWTAGSCSGDSMHMIIMNQWWLIDDDDDQKQLLTAEQQYIFTHSDTYESFPFVELFFVFVLVRERKYMVFIITTKYLAAPKIMPTCHDESSAGFVKKYKAFHKASCKLYTTYATHSINKYTKIIEVCYVYSDYILASYITPFSKQKLPAIIF